jgi:hypothetical protein
MAKPMVKMTTRLTKAPRRLLKRQGLLISDTKPDLVDHPPHYNKHPSGVECIAVAEHFNFCLGNALKYIWRAGEKPGADRLEDLKKSRWYLNREIMNEEKKQQVAIMVNFLVARQKKRLIRNKKR